MSGSEPELPYVSPEDWARTPPSVRRLVEVLILRLDAVSARVEELEEKLGKNSSKPVSVKIVVASFRQSERPFRMAP